MTHDDALHMWTIYENPSDYPGRFVVRECTIERDSTIVTKPEPAAVVLTLEDARAAVPDGLYRLARAPGDEPHIVEVWL